MAGKYFEELNVGDKLLTPRRTLTEADVVNYCTMTWNSEPLHNDIIFIREQTPFRDRLVPGPMTLAFATGLEIQSGLVVGRVIAQLEIDHLKFTNPVYPGDTIQSEIEVIEKKETSKPDRGVVNLKHTVRNQDGTIVAEFSRLYLLRRKPAS